MKLVLVDRRCAAAAVVIPAPVDLLADLAAPLGRPEWTLNLVLVDDAEMAALNARYRETDEVTDVLSFSYLETATAADPELAANDGGLAGEIVLAPGFIEARCLREEWDPAAEWALLVVHGALHVLGWAHRDARQRREMQAREAHELARLGLRHPLLSQETRS